MRKKTILKGLLIVLVSIISIISTFVLDESINNNFICLSIMFLFFIIECYGLFLIIREKYMR